MRCGCGSYGTIGLDVVDDSHIGILLPMVRAYHEFEHITLLDDQRRAALSPLTAENSQFGRIWLIQYRGEIVSYIALCFGYSIEFCGRDAFVDEFYLKEKARVQGISSEVLAFVQRQAARLGVVALYLEVTKSNEKAKRLYASSGFRSRDSYHLMSYVVMDERRCDPGAS